MLQVNTAGSMCLTFDVSSSCQCMAFGDAGGSIHLYTSSPHTAMFNTFSRETEFADPVEPLPPISILDEVTPLSTIPLPYTQPGASLLSDWPEQFLRKVYRLVLTKLYIDVCFFPIWIETVYSTGALCVLVFQLVLIWTRKREN